nr:hypothetical protein GCM10020093_106740 [Planobispora longispora]
MEGLPQGAHLVQVGGAEVIDAAHLPPFHELAELSQIAQTVLAPGGGGGVDQVDGGGE